MRCSQNGRSASFPYFSLFALISHFYHHLEHTFPVFFLRFHVPCVKIRKRYITDILKACTIFMTINIIISGLAIQRYSERQNGQINAQNPVEEFLDQHYPNERMERIYPNAKFPQKK